MLYVALLYVFYLLGLIAAAPGSQLVLQSTSVKPSISWELCGEMSGHTLECGRLAVPLDYGDPTLGRASLSVMRLLAWPDKRRASIFTNPGGPGVSGTGGWHRERSLVIMEESGGEYDIVRSGANYFPGAYLIRFQLGHPGCQ